MTVKRKRPIISHIEKAYGIILPENMFGVSLVRFFDKHKKLTVDQVEQCKAEDVDRVKGGNY
jgi:hypothetical protein